MLPVSSTIRRTLNSKLDDGTLKMTNWCIRLTDWNPKLKQGEKSLGTGPDRHTNWSPRVWCDSSTSIGSNCLGMLKWCRKSSARKDEALWNFMNEWTGGFGCQYPPSAMMICGAVNSEVAAIAVAYLKASWLSTAVRETLGFAYSRETQLAYWIIWTTS